MEKNKFCHFNSVFCLVFFVVLGLLVLPSFVKAQSRAEYRAFWVDTFNTALNNHADVVNVVNNAKAAKANAIFAQVRRRGDAWYLNSLEPKPDFTPIDANFDPLQALIDEAHANAIEVHAFVIIGAVWNKNPTFAPTATLGPPTNPNHVFNLHGGYDPVTEKIVPGPNNWLTRTLLPDGSAGISFQGHRFGNDFWIDLGHPDAAAYTANVLLHLVRNYNIDGLHLDRIRYPEISISGQTPTTGTNIGYNETSVARFNTRFNRTGTPATGDPLWMQWRRDQVTNLVRRVYLNAIAIEPQVNKPPIKISAALIAFGGAPTCPTTTICANDTEIWQKSPSAEAYWRVYQDWRAWTEEGILDIAIPMNYKREHNSEKNLYNSWNEWLKNHQYRRAAMVGQGAFLNSIEGTLPQTRRALAPSSTGNSGIGIIYFSMATSNVAVTANPLSIPPGQNTPARSFAEFASGLTTGKSVNGLTLYENPETNPTPIFSQPATIPVLPWKAAPANGHIMGFAKRGDNTPLDTATVTITNLDTNDTRSTTTDGGGFYGGVDLTPGNYLVKAVLNNETLYSCAAHVVAGRVTTADLQVETIAHYHCNA